MRRFRRTVADVGIRLELGAMRRYVGGHKIMLDSLKRFFGPTRISLLHATRNRVERAVACKRLWLEAADKPERVEHLFAIDPDDAVSAAGLQGHTVVTVAEEGRGCVGAWNLAAEHSTGDILVQLSDDWLPLPGWDTLFENRLAPVKKPWVLRISDGHRVDDLFCMAIITRARMVQQGWFLPPAYTGIYSDDEFSFRAFEDGVVVDARDLVFVHEHPNYDSAIEMDETYRRQNDDSRYEEARGVFKERNPAAKKRWFVKDHWERRWVSLADYQAANPKK